MSRLAAMRANVHESEDIDNTTQKDADEPVVDRREMLLAKTGMSNASEYQIDIFEHLDIEIENYVNSDPTSGLLVTAVAGSGKTSTIVAAAKLIPSHLNTVFLAFNKSIATELKERLPRHINTSTLNSLGYKQIIPYAKALGCHVDPYTFSKPYRTNAIIRNEYDWNKRDGNEKYVTFLVSKCKAMGVIPVGVTDGWAIDGREATDETLDYLLKHFDETVDPIIRPTVFAMVRNVLNISWSDSNIYDTNCIDFDDQIWLTVCKRPNGKKLAQPIYDVIFIDECQDLNATNIELIRMVLKPNGVVIGVGDKNQAIYKFRGADTKAMEKFENYFRATPLPLSITYRCSKQVTEHAQELVPTIQHAPNAAEGKAPVLLERYNADIFQSGDMVLCRNNAPLLSLAYKLIKHQVPVHVKGRDIGEKLVSLINDCVAVKKWAKVNGRNVPSMSVAGANVNQLHHALISWKSKQLEVIKADDPDNQLAFQGIEDRFASMMVFIENNTDGKVTTVVDQIENLFSDKDISDMVVFSSVHKAKGLEADRVFMLSKECMYPWWIKKGTDEYQQETNIDYVARTRAKLYYAYLPTNGWVD
jgi:DNA helicase-2/ATP-dependent DNA helicase PcrA